MPEPKTSRPFQERFLDGYDRSQLREEVQKVKPKRFGSLRKKYATWALGGALALGGIGLLHDHFHGYRQAIWLLAGAAAVAALAGLLAERTAPRQRERWVGA